MSAVAVSVVYVCAAVVFLASGVDKILVPRRLADMMNQGQLNVVGGEQAVRLVGLAETILGLSLVSVSTASGAATVNALAVSLYLIIVTPIGVTLSRRTGSCGCGPLTAGRHNRASEVTSLVLRNMVIIVVVVGHHAAWTSASVIVATELAVGLVVGAQSVRLLRQLARTLTSSAEGVEARHPRPIHHPAFVE